MKSSKIAIFIDVENLTEWVKEDGPEKLLSELSSTGQIIVRRAYGIGPIKTCSIFKEI